MLLPYWFIGHRNEKLPLVVQIHALRSILKELRAQKYAWAFLTPVDTTLYPEYLQIVKQPMGACVRVGA